MFLMDTMGQFLRMAKLEVERPLLWWCVLTFGVIQESVKPKSQGADIDSVWLERNCTPDYWTNFPINCREWPPPWISCQSVVHGNLSRENPGLTFTWVLTFLLSRVDIMYLQPKTIIFRCTRKSREVSTSKVCRITMLAVQGRYMRSWELVAQHGS